MEAFRKMLKSKIHRATVTHADVNYEGSITLAPELLEAAKMAEFEAVHVWNVSAGTRFQTYTICGLPGSTDICINGAAARLVTPGDLVIVATFTWIPEKVLLDHKPTLVFVDQNNRLKEIRAEVPGPGYPGSRV